MNILSELFLDEKFARFKLQEFNVWQNFKNRSDYFKLEFTHFQKRYVTRSGVVQKLFRLKTNHVGAIAGQYRYEFSQFGAERIEDSLLDSRRRQFLEATNCRGSARLTCSWSFNPISVAIIGLNTSPIFCAWLGLNKPCYSIGYCYQVFKQLKNNEDEERFLL